MPAMRVERLMGQTGLKFDMLGRLLQFLSGLPEIRPRLGGFFEIIAEIEDPVTLRPGLKGM